MAMDYSRKHATAVSYGRFRYSIHTNSRLQLN